MQSFTESCNLFLSTINNFAKKTEDHYLTIEDIKYIEEAEGFQAVLGHYSWSEKLLLNAYATGQLLSTIGIPGNYFKKCPSSLKRENSSYWLFNHRNKQIVARRFNSLIRAIVSKKYNTELDDVNTVPMFLESIKDLYKDKLSEVLINAKIKSSEMSYVEILFEDHKVKEGPGKHFQAGVCFTNSEVGAAALKIKPIICCYNSVYLHTSEISFMDSSSEGTLKVNHVGEFNKDAIAEAIVKAQEVAQVGIYRLMEVDKETVQNPKDEIGRLVKKSNYLTQRMFKVIKEQKTFEESMNKLLFSKTILNAIGQLPLFQYIKASQDVGRYLNLFESTEKRVTTIKKNLTQIKMLDI